MNFTPAPDAFCTVLEFTLNHYLKLDEQALKPLAAYQNKVMHMQITGFYWSIYFLPIPHGFRLQGDYNATAETTVTASPRDLLQLSLADNLQPDMRKPSLKIDGDIGFAQAFNKALCNVHMDWEEWLAKAVGDFSAHRIGSGIRNVIATGKRDITGIKETIIEYLQEEAHLLPSQLEAGDLTARMDLLRDRIACVQARVRQQESRTTDEKSISFDTTK